MMFISERSKTQEPDVRQATTMYRLRILCLFNKQRRRASRLLLTGLRNILQFGLTSMTMVILTTVASIFGQALQMLGVLLLALSLYRQR